MGAETPQEAANSLVDAINKKDPIAILRVMEPETSGGLIASVDVVQDRAAQEVGTAKGAEFDALDIRLEGVEPRVEQLSARVARATFDTGQVSITLRDRSKLPERIEPLISGEFSKATIDLAALRDHPESQHDLMQLNGGRVPSVMIVKEGDRWFVSPLYTVGDALVSDAKLNGGGGPQAVFGDDAPESVTQATPELAVEAFLRDVSAGDYDGAGKRLVPSEIAAWQAFSQATPFAQLLGEWAAGGSSVTATVASSSVIAIDKGHSVVRVESARGEVRDGGASTPFTITGDCVESQESFCMLHTLDRRDQWSGSDARLHIMTAKVGDGWAVSISGTAAQTLRSGVEHADVRALLYRWGVGHLLRPQTVVEVGATAEIELPHGAVHVVQIDVKDSDGEFTLVKSSAGYGVVRFDELTTRDGLWARPKNVDDHGRVNDVYDLAPGLYTMVLFNREEDTTATIATTATG